MLPNTEKTHLHNEKIVAVCLSAFISLLFYFLNIQITGPVVQGDEGSYIAYAAAYAGYFVDAASSYHSGYSLLLSPAYMLANNSDEAFQYLRLINSLLWGFTSLITYLLLKKIYYSESGNRILLVTAICMLYPAWAVYSGYAFSENAYVLFFVLCVYLLIRVLENDSWHWIIWWATIAFLYTIHPKAAVVIIAAGLTSVIIIIKTRKIIYPLLGVAVFLCIVALYKYHITPWLVSQMTLGDLPATSHYPSIKKVLTVLVDIEQTKDLLIRILGHTVYFTLASLGLILVLFTSVYKWCVENRSSIFVRFSEGYHPVFVFISLSLLGTILLSSLLFTSGSGERFDHWVYGRYVEGVFLPVLALSLMAFLQNKSSIPIKFIFIITIVLLLILPEGKGTAPLNISSFWPQSISFLSNQSYWLQFFLVLLTILVFHYLQNKGKKIIFLAFIFIISGSSHIFLIHSNHVKTHGNRHANAYIIRDIFERGSCVAFDRSSSKNWWHPTFHPHYIHYLYDYHYVRLKPDNWHKNCDGPILSWDTELDKQYPGVYPIAKEKRDGPILWIKPKVPINLRTIDLNKTYVFSDVITRIKFLGSGWHQTESWGNWADSNATISVLLPGNCVKPNRCEFRINMQVFAASEDAPKHLRITLNGDTLKTVQVVTGEQQFYSVPLTNIDTDQNAAITVEVNNAVSPSQIGLSNDERILGVGAISMYFTGVAQTSEIM